MSPGLYEKYTVLKEGKPQRNCFVLKPRSDPAARAALEAYADATDDERLAEDIREWLEEERAWREGTNGEEVRGSGGGD